MAERLQQAWPEFLQAVDGAPSVDKIAALATKLTDKGWASPMNFVEATQQDVIGSLEGVEGAELPFMRRAVTRANTIAKEMAQAAQIISSAQAVQPHATGSVVQPEVVAQLHGMFGNETSALQLAEALAGGSNKLDVSKLMQNASLDNVLDEFCPAEELYRALSLATEQAKKVSRKAFTFVDLTHGSVLPEFLPPEAVGGKTVVAGHDDILSGYTGNLGQFASTLKHLTSAPRMFRNTTQWCLAFMRYAVVAVAAEQVSWSWVVMHMQVVCRVSLEHTQIVAILYDELSRRSWARRMAKNDQTLDIMKEAAMLSTQMIDLAKSKVANVTRAAGLRSSDGAAVPASSQNSGLEAAEGVLSKQITLAGQVSKQAEQAMSRLNNMRNNIPNHWDAGGKGAGKHGGKKGFNKFGGKKHNKRKWKGFNGGQK